VSAVVALSAPAPATPPPAAPAVSAPPGQLESLIVKEYPPLFEEFRKKCFKLLWRGSRDGFSAREFHYRCDGRANTLTLIRDTNRNVFGGFTPVNWELQGDHKNDDSLKSFLFTLKNAYTIPARKFVMRAKKPHRAIFCDSGSGPRFWDIGVCDECGTNSRCFTGSLGSNSINGTGINGLN
jgi:hypothetical protein